MCERFLNVQKIIPDFSLDPDLRSIDSVDGGHMQIILV